MRARAAALLLALASAASAATEAKDGFAWKQVDEVHDAVRPYPSPIDPATVYIWTRGGLVATHDGQRFAALPAAPQLGEITALLIAPNRPQRLYVGTKDHGVFVSDDDGKSWTALGGTDRGLARARIGGLAFSPDDSDFATIYATHSYEQTGISVTIDGGKTWRAFAGDYGARDCLALGTAIFFAGRSESQGEGFFRFDPARGWLCLLTEEARSLVGSRVDHHRVWFGTQGAGLRVSDDFGITMRDDVTGPKNGDIVSIAVGWASPTEEVVYAYDPAGEGVMRSRDGFATWEKLDDGFGASEWTREGACLATDAVGSTVWACRNGELWRGAAPLKAPLRSQPRAEPGAVVVNQGAVTFSCRAEPGSKLTIDCSALGGPKDLAFAEGADGTYTAKLEKAAPQHPRQYALPLSAERSGATAQALAVVTVLPQVGEVPLWNGEAQNNGVTWPSGGVSIARSEDHPLSAPAHIRVTVAGAGRAGFGWNGWGGGVDASRYKLFAFAIRSDRAGPTKIRLALRDDGSGSGLQNSQVSHEVELSRYLPEIGQDYRFVAIPVADFVAGSPCAPTGLRELMVISDDPEPRLYDIDDIELMPRALPRLGGAEVRLLDDDRTVALAVTAASVGAPVAKASVRVGDAEVPLFDDGAHGDGAANDGRWATTVPVDRLGRGTKVVAFHAAGDDGEAELSTKTFVPSRPAVACPRIDAAFTSDGGAAEVAAAPALKAQSGALALEARLAHQPRSLRIAFDVTDPGFAPAALKDPDIKKLSSGPCVELVMSSPHERRRGPGGATEPVYHRAVFAVAADGGHAAAGNKHWACAGAKTDHGWHLESELPLELFDVNGAKCEASDGSSARFQLIVHGSGGVVASWAGGDGAVEDVERFGELVFADASGPPRWRGIAAAGTVLTMQASKSLDRRSAENPASWRAEGLTIVAAALDIDARTVRLTADRPWPNGAEARLSFPGVRCEDGVPASGTFAFTPQLGLAVDDGFIKEFLIGEVKRGIDPWHVDKPFADEAQHPARSAAWSYLAAPGGVVDLFTNVGGENSVAHAHVYVWSEADRAVQLWLGSDDGLRVAVNGACVHQFAGARGVTPDQDKVPNVALKKGWNDVMVAITQGGGGWGFCLRIRDDKGGAPVGLRYSADSPFAAAR